ncbi:hypothetical protein [Aquimarina sp. 2201CG14-23]|uniref:hypothetical protein n=1 Tax=Aquimarina mycalae TaxID=3040073 RepID=UPI002478233C|nr:hypothetical protein [Aquimarina sp. 2201CG14-23]MDH7447611.1 hypothetical protein [Aquimarina sp. 2201CG14-23]
MNNYRKIIDTFKSSKDESVLIDFGCIDNGKYGDKNYSNRKNLILELYSDYSAEDKPLLKWLLKEELKGFEFDVPVYTADLCAFMLYKYMEMADIYDLYDAKFGAGSDNQAYVDVELVFGRNRDETKAFLRNEKTQLKLNKEILETIEWYESNPNAKFKSREEYIVYFETIKAENIKSDVEEY